MARVSLEQWRMLDALVSCGSYSGASAQLHKSQSAINHAVQKLQAQLGVTLVEVVGRRTQLTAVGAVLLRRARTLIDEASELEQLAQTLGRGVEPELKLAVENLFPGSVLMQALARFSDQCPHTRIELYEEVLTGGEERLIQGQVDLLISARVPAGFLGDPLATLELIAVAHPEHPLHQAQQPLSRADLKTQRQLVIRDSGRQRNWNPGWLGAEQRWTVSHISSSIAAVRQGLGFSWFPRALIGDELASGCLKPLELVAGAERSVTLFLSHADPELAGHSALALAQLIRSELARSTLAGITLP